MAKPPRRPPLLGSERIVGRKGTGILLAAVLVILALAGIVLVVVTRALG